MIYVWLLGTKDEFEDLGEVSGQVFEYEFPQKKKEDPVPAAVPEQDWYWTYC